MGAIEDTRKVLQDFLAPELGEIKARLEALEKRMDERFAQSEKRIDERLAHSEKLIDERFAHAEKQADRRFDQLQISINAAINFNEFRERLARLESRDAVHQ